VLFTFGVENTVFFECEEEAKKAKRAKKAKFQLVFCFFVLFAFFASTLTILCESDFENAP
jgi:hypothetical protein